MVTRGKVKVDKKHTDEMIADVLTKAVTAPRMERMVSAMNFEFREGKRDLALQA